MTKIVTLGEILVEIVATEQGQGFREPVELIGPFPSGAPAIFIDQVAKLGQPCGIIGCVGDDDFGWANLERLRRDGVDVSAVQTLSDQATGSAFVRYRESGERDFVYNIKHSACGQLDLDDKALELLRECGHLHISGTSLFSDKAIKAASDAVDIVKAKGGSVSFDPNVRKEVMRDPSILHALVTILARCDLFLPSVEELTMLTQAATPDEAVSEVLGLGVTAIVVKDGARGATFLDGERRVEKPAYPVNGVDPTGAGDCFDAAYVTCRWQGHGVDESLEYANAAGAHAVSVRGPMEGTAGFAELDALRAKERPGGGSTSRSVGFFQFSTLGQTRAGITSVCSAHPLVLEAAMVEAAARRQPVLIEATCNQVNHRGGYTGLTPAAFRELLHGIAGATNFPVDQIILGGDHLGPSPWRHLAAEEALTEAELMVAAYVAAGFQKIHLDTSMGCRGEPTYVSDEVTAQRAARLAALAEGVGAKTGMTPVYVVGSEVPTPGGATEEIKSIEVTRPEAVRATLEAHRIAFASAGANEAYDSVIAVVAQPGVEFDDVSVMTYDPEKAAGLRTGLATWPGLVFEAHSTDYQPPERLAQLVRDGFAILKVGPGLTFALRQALYGLDNIATALDRHWAEHSLIAEMEREMVANPRYWEAYYHGGPEKERWLRHYSYSDRIRYYWAIPTAQSAVERLFAHLGEIDIPEPLMSEFLPQLYSRVVNGLLPTRPRTLALQAVRDVLGDYEAACDQSGR
ncbi:MAG TPA: PfkB family carbohydrate kinase [Acidimicrobiales bacterium]|nr:PfkB family carbohydrate kinase [Acidimicrobiales bacterium]